MSSNQLYLLQGSVEDQYVICKVPEIVGNCVGRIFCVQSLLPALLSQYWRFKWSRNEDVCNKGPSMGLFPLWHPDSCPQPDGELTLRLLEPVQVRFLQAVMDPQARDWGSSYPETRSL